MTLHFDQCVSLFTIKQRSRLNVSATIFLPQQPTQKNCFRCFAAAEDDVNRAIELSKDKQDPALQRLLKSITKARGKLAVATADYMTPPPPVGGAVGGDVPLYYSLDVSAVGGGMGGRLTGVGIAGVAVSGQLSLAGENRNEQQQQQQQQQYHQQQQFQQQQQQHRHQHQQQLASPQLSQESLGIFSADSASASSVSSRSLEILQVTRQ
jgi:hypothetical protein